MKIINVMYGTKIGGLFRKATPSIIFSTRCGCCGNQDKSFMFDLTSERNAPYPDEDLSKDDVKKLIEILQEGL